MALTAVLLVIFNWDGIVNRAAQRQFAKERARYEERIARLEKDLATLTEESATSDDSGPLETPEPLSGATSSKAAVNQETDCARLEREIRQSLAEIETWPYLKKYHFENGLPARLELIRKKLLAHPPIVVRETDSLYSILTNTAHFYRVLGKDDLMLLHDIINSEGDQLEDTLALFYQWSEKEDSCGKENKFFPLPLEKLYEYAGFFLNTLGGQAYLFRRDLKTRILVQYYCIMIIDRANARIINRHGIDLRPTVEAVIRELKVAPPLKFRDRYLARLLSIKGRYAEAEASAP